MENLLYESNKIQSIVNIKDSFLISWHMTGWCNFHCPYCIAEPLRTKWIDESVMLKYAEALNELIKKNLKDKKIELKLIGGEVTYYNLEKILDKIENINKVILVTNLSQSLDYFYSFEDYCANRNIQLVLICSYHEENLNFKEKFLKLVEWCRSHKRMPRNYKDPQLTLVVDNNFKPEMLEDYLNRNVWRIRLTTMRDNNQVNVKLKEDILKYLYQYNQTYEERVYYLSKGKGKTYRVTFSDKEIDFTCASNFTNFINTQGFIPDGFYCSAGLTAFALLPNGDITLSRCDFLINKPIGSIDNWQDIILPSEPVLCALNKDFGYPKKRCDLCAGTNLYRRKDGQSKF